MRATQLLLVCVLLAAAAGAAEAAQARKLLQPSADHPGKCYDPDLKLVLTPGATEPAKGKCESYRCSKTGNGFELVITSCGSVAVASGCTVATPNPNLPHPQCCPEVKC